MLNVIKLVLKECIFSVPVFISAIRIIPIIIIGNSNIDMIYSSLPLIRPPLLSGQISDALK
jgi:hypothetical protein